MELTSLMDKEERIILLNFSDEALQDLRLDVVSQLSGSPKWFEKWPKVGRKLGVDFATIDQLQIQMNTRGRLSGISFDMLDYYFCLFGKPDDAYTKLVKVLRKSKCKEAEARVKEAIKQAGGSTIPDTDSTLTVHDHKPDEQTTNPCRIRQAEFAQKGRCRFRCLTRAVIVTLALIAIPTTGYTAWGIYNKLTIVVMNPVPTIEVKVVIGTCAIEAVDVADVLLTEKPSIIQFRGNMSIIQSAGQNPTGVVIPFLKRIEFRSTTAHAIESVLNFLDRHSYNNQVTEFQIECTDITREIADAIERLVLLSGIPHASKIMYCGYKGSSCNRFDETNEFHRIRREHLPEPIRPCQ